MKKNEWLFLVVAFFSWRIAIQLFAALSIEYLPVQVNFLGGGLESYNQNPHFWGWGNFDGEHYVLLARYGYLPLTHFYFPVYALLGKYLSGFIGQTMGAYLFSLLAISNITFFIGLIGFYRLCKVELNQLVAKYAVISLLVFPASFYFAAAYTESIFFMLAVWAFYFARQKRWLLAGLTGGVLTAVRIVGISLLPALLFEVYKNIKLGKSSIKQILALFTIPTGLLGYMIYLKLSTGDPLAFFNNVSLFGQQRSEGIVILPQVFYRYIFKIIPNTNFSYWPGAFTTMLELATALLFVALIIWSFKKLNKSLAIFSLLVYLIPTLSGSFSSLPRYVLAAFPVFFLIGFLVTKYKYTGRIYIAVSTLGLMVATAMFFRGYWLS